MKRIKRKELLSILKKKVDLQTYNLIGADFSRLNLSGYDLSFLDLSKAKFEKTNLKNANFIKSSLKGSCFSRANLEETRLKGADCSHSDFTKANLYRADLTRANLKDIVIYKTTMKCVNLNEASLESTNLSRTDFSNCKARKANFQRANLTSSCLNKADFQEANLEGAILSDVEAKGTNFSGSCLLKANLEGSVLDKADFSHANLIRANLSLSSLKEINLEKANLKQANFKYSRGLSEDTKQYLEQHQAKVSRIWDTCKEKTRFVLKTPWTFALLIGFLISLGIYGYFYFSDLNHLSISSLQRKWKNAKQHHQYKKVLQIDSVLIKKFEEKGNYEAIFNKSLDLSKNYRILGRNNDGIEVLEEMLKKFNDDPEKRAKIKLELALIYKNSEDWSKTISILEDIKLSKIKRTNIFPIKMELAQAYFEAKRYEEAISKCKEIENLFNHDPLRLSSVLRKMAGFYNEIGEIEKARKTWAKVPWDPENPRLYFKSQMEIASSLFKEGRYEESRMTYIKLEKKLISYPELRKKIEKKFKNIEKKMEK